MPSRSAPQYDIRVRGLSPLSSATCSRFSELEEAGETRPVQNRTKMACKTMWLNERSPVVLAARQTAKKNFKKACKGKPKATGSDGCQAGSCQSDDCTSNNCSSDANGHPVKMSFSRLCKRTNLFTYLENLQHSYPESRCTPNALGWSSYNFIRANTGYQRGFNNDIWALKLGCKFSTRSFDKCSRFSPLASGHIGRSCSSFNAHRHYASQAFREQKSRKTLLYLTALVFAMVGSSYAAVPLYRRFCQATGYGGTVQRRESVEEKIVRHAKDGTVTTREIVVQFNADVADGMPWKFVPTQREVRVKPGESALAFYTAENRSPTPITGVSTYNVTPMKAAVYFNKIQCFCFEEQRLLPGEQIDMPVFFYIDPEFEADPRMDGINNIILSYTFFKVSEQ